MTTRHFSRILRISISVFPLAHLACSDESGPAGTSVIEALAVITGPDQVVLGCLTPVVGEFNASQSSGPINGYRWEVDGTEVSQAIQLKYTFREPRNYTITLKGLNQAGSVVATDTKTVTVLPPVDLVGCLNQSRIIGREGVLLRTGHTSVTSEYTVNTAALAQGSVDSYTWTLAKEGGDPETLVSGPSASSVQVTFTEGGVYEIGVEQVIGTTTLNQKLPVKIYTGDPVSEPGKIVFSNFPNSLNGEGGRSTVRGIYFMDGETGHVSGPILEEEDPLFYIGGGGLACDADRVVLTAVDDSSEKNNLWQMNHDGTGLIELVDAVGLLQQPDISDAGDIAFIDDTRWNFAKDELAIYTAWGSLIFASGPTVDTVFNGRHPSWSPDGSRVALGANEVLVNGEGAWRVSIFHVAAGGHNIYREAESPPEFPYLLANEVVFHEGGNSVAWDPRGEYIAYNVTVYDPTSMDPVTLNYDTRWFIALWKIGSSEVRILLEDLVGGRIAWSPNGDYLLFHKAGDGWVDDGIWQIPREGGEAVNLSAITMEGAYDHLGGFCKGFN